MVIRHFTVYKTHQPLWGKV